MMRNKVDQFYVFHGTNKISMTTCSEDNAFVIPAAGELAPALLVAYLTECRRLGMVKQHLDYVQCLIERVKDYQVSPTLVELIDCKFFFFASSIYGKDNLTQQHAFLMMANDPAVPPALETCIEMFTGKGASSTSAYARSYLERTLAYQKIHGQKMPFTNLEETERCQCQVLSFPLGTPPADFKLTA